MEKNWADAGLMDIADHLDGTNVSSEGDKLEGKFYELYFLEAIDSAELNKIVIDKIFNAISEKNMPAFLDDALKGEVKTTVDAATANPYFNAEGKNAAIRNAFKYHIKDLVTAADKYITDAVKEDITNTVKNFKSIVDPERKTKKTYTHEEELDKLIEKENDPEMKESLQFVKEEVLSQIAPEENTYFSQIGEKIPAHYNYQHSRKSAYALNANPILKDSIKMEDNGVYNYDPDQQARVNTKEYKDTVANLKMTFTPETKAVLKEALTFLDNMKDINGNPLLDMSAYKPEEGSKAYAFKNFVDTRKKAEAILKDDKIENKAEELKKVADFYKKTTADYEKLIEICNKLNMDSIPTNISVSRNENMPAEFVKDYKGASVVNGLWHTLANLKITGLSMDEYLENPIEVYRKKIENFKGYNDINAFGKKLGDLDFIKEMESGRNSSKLNGLDQTRFAMSTGSNRFLISNAMFDTENGAENRMVCNLYNYVIAHDLRPTYQEFVGNYFLDEKLETYKNILFHMEENKNYAGLTMSTHKVPCAVTGVVPSETNYKDMIKTGNVDYAGLAKKLTDISNAVATKNEYAMVKNNINTAIRSLAMDILKTKQFDNLKEFNDFAKLSGKTMGEIFAEKKGDMPLHQYVTERIDNEANTPSAFNALKGLVQYHNSKYFLTNFWKKEYWQERTAINTIKEEMRLEGFDTNVLNDFLKGRADVSQMVEYDKAPGKFEMPEEVKPVEKAEVKEEVVAEPKRVQTTIEDDVFSDKWNSFDFVDQFEPDALPTKSNTNEGTEVTNESQLG